MTVSRDEVVLQKPEDIRFLLDVFHTATFCAGSAASYVLRRIAYRAGTYAPGIDDFMWRALHTVREGGSLEAVQTWFSANHAPLQALGYRLQCRRVNAPTETLINWVSEGKGYRGAMLPTRYTKLHAQPGESGKEYQGDVVAHAVGLTVDRLSQSRDEELVLIDPWPGFKGAVDRDKVPPALPSAHRERGYHALTFFWTGWS